MCWSLRAFLRYLHHQGLSPRALADCVPSVRRWKLAGLPTFLPTAQVQRALDGCDRATPMGWRDYAILMIRRIAYQEWTNPICVPTWPSLAVAKLARV
jgi:integrase